MLRLAKQVVEVKKKASKILGILQRNLATYRSAVKKRAYPSLVRPVTEYATVAWSPLTHKDTNCAESVQCCIARFAYSNYQQNNSVSELAIYLRNEGLRVEEEGKRPGPDNR